MAPSLFPLLTFNLSPLSFLFVIFIAFTFLPRTAHAFGAGTIDPDSPIKGTNWLHGDITQILLSIPSSTLTKTNFSEHDVKVIYFGSWLRDLSQVIDAGVLKLVPEAVARAVVGVLGYVEFGSSTCEFEVTKDRLGCYRHEEHIDNPKGYITEGNKELDPRLRTEIDPKEYEVDHRSGMLNLVANEKDIKYTATGYMRKTLKRVIRLGREGRKNDDQKMIYEAYIALGAVLHVLDDFAAHSNYIELALNLLGEKDIFLYTGDKAVEVGPKGHKIAPLVTGTFGTEDLWHSLLGSVNDKAAAQGIEHPAVEHPGTNLADLEERLKDARDDIGGTSNSLIDSLSLIPSGIIPNSLNEYIRRLTHNSEEIKEHEDRASEIDSENETEAKWKEIDDEVRKLELRAEKLSYGDKAEKGQRKEHPQDVSKEGKKEKHVSELLEDETKRLEEEKEKKKQSSGTKGEGSGTKSEECKSEDASDAKSDGGHSMAFGHTDDEGANNTPSLRSEAEESENSVPLSNLAWSTHDMFDVDLPTWAIIAEAPSEFLQHIKPILELRDTIAEILSSASLPSLPDISFPFDLSTGKLELPNIELPNVSLPEGFDLNLGVLLQRISGAVDSATFSFLSPYMLPVVQKLRETLTVASHEMLDREGNQFDVFRADSDSLCPSHSLLSKDHFTNVLQHPAGLVATVMTELTVRSVVSCWDGYTDSGKKDKGLKNEEESERKCIEYILSALHHPYYVHTGKRMRGNKMQNEMLRSVRGWWLAQTPQRQRELRHVLSKEGVEKGLNHRASREKMTPGPWKINYDEDHEEVIEGLVGWNRRKWSAKGDSRIDGVLDMVDGVRRDPVGSAWRFAKLVVQGEVTPAGLYRDGVDTAKGVFEEAVWGKQEKTVATTPSGTTKEVTPVKNEL